MTRSLQAIQRHMEAKGIDTLLVMRPVNVAYLLKWYDYTHMSLVPEQANFLVVPQQGTPLFVNKGFICGAVEAPGRPDWLTSHHEAPGANPLVEIDFLVEQIRGAGWGSGRIGIEMEWLPVAIFEPLREQLPGASLVAADAILKQARATKDAHETELLRHANRLFEQAYETAIAHLAHTGDFQQAMSLLAQHWARGGGTPHFVPSQSHGYDWDGIDSDISKKRREVDAARYYYDPDNGEMWGDYCLQYQGYWLDRGSHQWIWPAKVQDRLQEIRSQQEAIRAVHWRILDALQLGMTARTARATLERDLSADLSQLKMWIVHGIGLDLHEEPCFGSWMMPPDDPRHAEDDEIRIGQGTVLCVETVGDVFLEEMYVATASGWQPLYTRPMQLVWGD